MTAVPSAGLSPIPLRVYQEEACWGRFPMIPRAEQQRLRRWALIWSRRRGKSYKLAVRSLVRMARLKHDVYFLSASRDTGQENIRKLIDVWKNVTVRLRAARLKDGGGVHLIDSRNGRAVDDVDVDGLADLFEASKLQVRLWHDHTAYSRTLLLAANPGTAVGYGGDVYFDEASRMQAFKEVLEAAGPIMQDQPDYEMGITTTPPPDDQHPSYQLLQPTHDDFTPNARGNYYVSQGGVLVHRVDALDAELAGMPFLDEDTGEPCSVWDALAKSFDQQAFRRNFLCAFIAGGSAAVSLAALNAACLGGATLGMAHFETGELAA